MDHVSLVLSLRRAVKTNDFELYAYCLGCMSDLFFSFGGQNYARYLTFFSVFISNVEFSHPGALNQIKLGVSVLHAHSSQATGAPLIKQWKRLL